MGRYPFDSYGSPVPDDANIGFALETQSLSLFDEGWFEAGQGLWEPTMVHELMRAIYAHGDEWRAEFGPVAQPSSGEVHNLFSFQAYHGGALVLYALRNRIGVQDFERLQRAWVDRYRHGVASTADFIAAPRAVRHRR